MIREINLGFNELSHELFDLQKASYLIEAELIKYYDIPPLRETFEQFITCNEHFLGYFEEEKLAGALSYSYENDVITICRMIVHPAHFRKGIAGKLLHAFNDIALSYKKIKVSTGKENVPAKNLYLKHHFEWMCDVEVAPSFYISFFERNNKCM